MHDRSFLDGFHFPRRTTSGSDFLDPCFGDDMGEGLKTELLRGMTLTNFTALNV